jgi:enoyl-CoA hydratase/carnithine racemase
MFRLTHDGAVARLTLDRPEARNAIPASGWTALAACLGEVEGRLLVLSGTGGAFCAGADLADFAAMREDEGARRRFREAMRAALDALSALPIPTVARIDGACYGAGVALAMACDLRVATAGARFAITPAKIGISYPQEDVSRLVALVGPGQAARLLFTAATIDGAEALRIGLADLDELDEAAILANDADSLAALKQAIARAGEGVRSDPALDARFDALIGGAEMARRLEALRRK